MKRFKPLSQIIWNGRHGDEALKFEPKHVKEYILNNFEEMGSAINQCFLVEREIFNMMKSPNFLASLAIDGWHLTVDQFGSMIGVIHPFGIAYFMKDE